MKLGEASMDAYFRVLIVDWATIWGVPELTSTVSVSFSTQLKRSLGRCRPADGQVMLRADLRSGDPERLREVLCHEVAHIAAYLKFGHAIKPHGVEWRGLVAAAGFRPRVRMAPPSEPRQPTRQPRPLAFEHRCPVCHSMRLARRKMPRWRCAECVDAGLDGGLLITLQLPLPANIS
jgi:predicted SprT family Zn-dependent metalloprotease